MCRDHDLEGVGPVAGPCGSAPFVAQAHTAHEPVEDSPLITQLRRPFGGVADGTVSSILNKYIEYGGGDRQLMSARCFRCGEATTAVSREINVDKILTLGRWASDKVSRQNYVVKCGREFYRLSVGRHRVF